MSKLYAVFNGTKWGMTTSKKQALTAAKKVNGVVKSVDYDHSPIWDMPTFWAVGGDVVADYRITPAPAPTPAPVQDHDPERWDGMS